MRKPAKSRAEAILCLRRLSRVVTPMSEYITSSTPLGIPPDGPADVGVALAIPVVGPALAMVVVATGLAGAEPFVSAEYLLKPSPLVSLRLNSLDIVI